MNNFFDAFISYGRADSLDFATKLYQRLTEQGLRVWFDKKNIPFGVDYQREIDEHGIEKAHNFIFIIAPHSLKSVYCRKEIDLAVQLKKRIIPLVHIKSDELLSQTHPNIGKLNWIWFQEGINNFEESFANLTHVIQKQADYVEQHTQILAKALEWERHQKQTSYLLIGEERQQAQSWLKKRFKHEQAPCLPNDLHCEFITESIKNANNWMTQVFLAYGEEDESVMEQIRNSLRWESFTVWTNKTDIQMGEASEEAIKRGIEQADNIVYLLSPDSLKSKFCQQELDYAVLLNKRIIPILVRETDGEPVPPALQQLQYIDLTDNVKQEDYLLDESQLLKILRQDAAYYNDHKILLAKALKWQRQHCNPSILLRGYNLRHAEAWLKLAKQRGQHLPTPLQEELITESLRQPSGVPLDVFVSYSRTDSDFARKLNDALQMQGKTTWFDQESIASGVDFQQEIYRGIEDSDNFLFILSSASVNSPYCVGEVEHAAKLNKRFVTVLYRQVNPADLHLELAKVQWIDFNQQEADFFANFNQLVRTLDTDREYVRNHTKWSQRAIEWEERGRSEDLLLRGSEFAIAENWLKETEQQKKQPAATPLQKEYITASRTAIEAARKQEKRQVIILWSLLSLVSAVAVIAAGIGVFAFSQWRRAETVQEGEINALSRYSLALSDQERKFDALIEAIRAGRQLHKQRYQVKAETKGLVLTALQAAVYGDGFREYDRLLGHDNDVERVSFSPDGKMIVTASRDKTLKLWSRDGQLLTTLYGHKKGVSSAVWSPDDKTIASTSWDKTLKLWSRDGKLLQTLEHDTNVNSASFSPDGKTIASASYKAVRLWNPDGKLLQIMPHDNWVNSVAWSPDGKTLASGSDQAVKLWSADGKLLQTLPHDNWVNSVAWSPDGKTLASGSDKAVKLWSHDGKLLQTLPHNNFVNGVAWSPDGKTLASAGTDKTAQLWSRSGQKLQTLLHEDEVIDIGFSPDGKILASASRDSIVKLWSLKGKKLKKFPHDNKVNSVAWSPDGKTIASASDKAINLWNVEGKKLQTLSNDNKVNSVAWSPDGKTIASASDKAINLWNLEGKKLQTLPHDSWVNDVAWSPDGKIIASASNKAIKLSSADGKLLKTLPYDTQYKSVSFSPDGKTIAASSGDGTGKLWSLDGKELHTFTHEDTVYSVSFSPDGNTLASASDDDTIKLWSRDGKLVKTLHYDTPFRSVSFSPNGKLFAAAGGDNTVKIWNLKGELLQTLKGHKAPVNSVSFGPDGNTLASAGQDNIVILWNLDDFRLEKLMVSGCDWVGDYLKYSTAVEEGDKHLCDGIGKK
jgi:WD40 repeat protein